MTAMMEPTLGIKFNKNVSSANKKANLTWKNIKINHTQAAVKREVIILTDKYLEILASQLFARAA